MRLRIYWYQLKAFEELNQNAARVHVPKFQFLGHLWDKIRVLMRLKYATEYVEFLISFNWKVEAGNMGLRFEEEKNLHFQRNAKIHKM